MIRIVFELVVLACIAGGVLYLARQVVVRRRPGSGSRALAEPPAEATWRATHHGTPDEQTEVQIILVVPGTKDVWDRRTCAVIANRDPDYDKLVFNALEEAKSRAYLLNRMRDEPT